MEPIDGLTIVTRTEKAYLIANTQCYRRAISQARMNGRHNMFMVNKRMIESGQARWFPKTTIITGKGITSRREDIIKTLKNMAALSYSDSDDTNIQKWIL